MDSVRLVQRLHQHRAWVNGNLLAAAAQLSDEHLKQSLPIGQGSVWRSLVHLYAAEYVWIEALLGNPAGMAPGDVPDKLPGNQLGPGAIADLAELKDRWVALGERWSKYLASLTPEKLDEPVYRQSLLTGNQPLGTRCADVLLHVCTHAQYTTAQVVNMLRQLGVEKFPDVMLIALARKEGLAG